MYLYKRLVVGLAFTETDESTIRYAAMISRLAKSEKVLFVHAVRNFQTLETIHKEYPKLLEPIDVFTKKQMQAEVGKYFNGLPETTLEYEVVEGSPKLELLRVCKEQEIDLLIIGKTATNFEDTKLPIKIARKVSCSALVVPAKAAPKIQNILVPIDFSDNAKDAIETGLNFAAAAGITNINCVHIYTVPIGYHQSGKSYEELFGKAIKEQAEKNCTEFLAQIARKGLSITPLFAQNNDVAEGVKKIIEQNQIDLILVGARGKEALAGLLMGSVTRALIKTTSIPLISVKRKGA